MKNKQSTEIASLLTKMNKVSPDSTSCGEMELDIPRITSGNRLLDDALGGGFAKGTIVEAYGAEQGGKSAIATLAAAQAQREGIVAYIDLEATFNVGNAVRHGVDMDALVLSQPGSAEETFEQIEVLVQHPGVAMIVVDSVAALIPQAEIEGDYTDAHMGLVARMMSKHFRKLVRLQRETRSPTIIFYVNQVREKMGGGGPYGPSTTTTGGRALKFYASQRLDVARIEALKSGEEIIGQRVRVKVQKNKGAPPFRQAILDLYYDQGFSNEAALIKEGIKVGVISKSGVWLTFNGESLGQGENKARLHLCDNPEITRMLSETLVTYASKDTEIR